MWVSGVADAGRSTAAPEDLQHRDVGDPRSEDAFQCGVDPDEQPANAVGQAGSFGGRVVEVDQHARFGQRIITDVDPTQGKRQGPGRIGAMP